MNWFLRYGWVWDVVTICYIGVDFSGASCYTSLMYIVASRRKSGGKTYTYYNLVEGVRTEKGPRHRVILSLGKLDHVREDRIRLLGRLIDQRLSGQKRLLPPEADEASLREEAERIARLVIEKQASENPSGERVSIDPEGMEVSEAVLLGPVHVGVGLWRTLGLDEILAEAGLGERQRIAAMVEVVARLVHPTSELATSRWVERTALGDLLARKLDFLSKDTLYRVSDKLWQAREHIEAALGEHERSLFALPETMVLYDLTSTYFEGRAESNGKAARGYSRDRRGDCKQLVVGLVLDEAGFPKATETWQGNTADSTTLAAMLDQLESRCGQQSGVTVVIDRGIASQDNLALLTERGYHYITGLAAGSRTQWLGEISEADFTPVDAEHPNVAVSLKQRDGEAFLLVRSADRIEKDRAIRERFTERLHAELTRIAEAVTSGKLTAEGAAERIGRARERYQRASRLFDTELIEDDEGLRLEWSYREERLAEAKALDGVYILRTDRMDLEAGELWQVYMMLQQVERSFRYLKSSLGIRPIYHQHEQRCDAHLFISLLAYHLLHTAEHMLRSQGEHRSWPTIMSELETHRVLTVSFDDDQGRRHHLRLATRPTESQTAIYRMLGLTANPLPKRRYVVEPESSHEN